MTWLDAGILLLAIVLTVVAVGLTQRFVPHQRRAGSNDVSGFVFSAVAAMYSVLLAFVVVAVWTNNDNARHTTFDEADSLAGVYWIARQMPLPAGSDVEQATLDYARLVAGPEWKLMEHHQSSPAATQLVYKMRAGVFSWNPETNKEQVMFDHAMTHVEQVASERRARLNQVGDDVPLLLWIALIGGGVLTVGIAFMFGAGDNAAHTFTVTLLAAMVVLSLVIVKEMNYPFSGITQVKPDAFEVFLQRLPPPR